MDLTVCLGAGGTLFSFLLFVPQARLTWTNRNRPERLDGISILSQVGVIANATTWGMYALLESAFWAGAPGLVNAPLATATIVLLLRSRRQRPLRVACPYCASGIEHKVFITAPPGWGSVVPCSRASRAVGTVVSSDASARALREQRPR